MTNKNLPAPPAPSLRIEDAAARRDLFDESIASIHSQMNALRDQARIAHDGEIEYRRLCDALNSQVRIILMAFDNFNVEMREKGILNVKALNDSFEGLRRGYATIRENRETFESRAAPSPVSSKIEEGTTSAAFHDEAMKTIEQALTGETKAA